MNNKLVKELRMLAKSIFLDTNEEANYKQLKESAKSLYEKFTVLEALEHFKNDFEEKEVLNKVQEDIIPPVNESKSPQIIEKKQEVETRTLLIEHETTIENQTLEEKEKKLVHTFEIKKEAQNNDQEIKPIQEENGTTLEHLSEFNGAIPIDEAANLFENATKQEEVKSPFKPYLGNTFEKPKSSVNDSLQRANIQIGLNDRIAFVNHLFEGSQQEFIRVLSQLNTFSTAEDAKNFLEQVVKPEYDWSAKEMYEQRLLDFIDRKFI